MARGRRWACGRGASRHRPLERLTKTQTATDGAVSVVFREEAGRLTAALVRTLGDFDLAEEVVQDSLVAALEKWPKQGIPDKPGAWLMTTARRRAIDILRRDKRYREKLAILERSPLSPDQVEADDRLRLIFTCCHPALSQEAQVALTRDIADDAIWLAGLVAQLMPDQPEVLGLLALMKLNVARSAARFDEAGEMVLLPEQDRRLWDHAAIADGIATLDRAGAMRATGPYQVQAAIAALHSEAASWDETDWHQIVVLYDALLRMADSPVVRLNRAIALSHFAGPQPALGEVNDLAMTLEGYHLFHSTRAELLDRLGEPALAREARRRALEVIRIEGADHGRDAGGTVSHLSGHRGRGWWRWNAWLQLQSNEFRHEIRAIESTQLLLKAPVSRLLLVGAVAGYTRRLEQAKAQQSIGTGCGVRKRHKAAARIAHQMELVEPV